MSFGVVVLVYLTTPPTNRFPNGDGNRVLGLVCTLRVSGSFGEPTGHRALVRGVVFEVSALNPVVVLVFLTTPNKPYSLQT